VVAINQYIMKAEKQINTIKCIATGKYRVIGGDVYSKKSFGWIKLTPTILPSKYRQTKITNGKKGLEKIVVIVYVHIFIYIFNNGAYDENLLIDHIDADVSNNANENLRAITKSENINPEKMRETRNIIGWINKPIRAK